MANKTGYQLERTFNRPLERYRTVTSITDRDAIPNGIRYKGMMCYVDGENKDYQLLGGVTNEDWTSVSADGLFNKDFDTTDDITEGANNKFLLQAEREKLGNIHFPSSNTFIGDDAGVNITGSDIYTLTGRESGRDASNATGLTATGVFAGRDSQGNKNTFTGWASGRDSQGEEKTATGFSSGVNSVGDKTTLYGANSGLNSNGDDITVAGANAGRFPTGNTLQTPNSTALGANTVIDKANQVVIGDAEVTEVKIGETLVIDKEQIVNGAEGLLVTKKVGGKTVTEVVNRINIDNLGVGNTIIRGLGDYKQIEVGDNYTIATDKENGTTEIGINCYQSPTGWRYQKDGIAYRKRYLPNGNIEYIKYNEGVALAILTGYNRYKILTTAGDLILKGSVIADKSFIVPGGVYATDAAAGAAGVPQNAIYKAPNGEIKYKL